MFGLPLMLTWRPVQRLPEEVQADQTCTCLPAVSTSHLTLSSRTLMVHKSSRAEWPTRRRQLGLAAVRVEEKYCAVLAEQSIDEHSGEGRFAGVFASADKDAQRLSR